MALRKRGKNGFWHAYFRSVVALPDGKCKYVSTTVNLFTTDLVAARALEADLMAKNKAARMHQRATAKIRQLEVAAGVRPVEDMPQPIIKEKRKRRLLIADALSAAEKYKKLGPTAKKLFTSFAKSVKCKYMDEVTPELAFEYLRKKCPETASGKSYNNNKSALNAVFRLTLLDAGLQESPFLRIPNRTLNSTHQRPFTEEELKKLYCAAEEPWKSAIVIALFTGLRQKDVFTLRWDQIEGDILTTLPAKTARFGRAVQIPIHPQLAEALAKIPRCGDRVLGAWPYNPASVSFQQSFSKLLRRLGIRNNIHGKVCFNSFRNCFISMCDAFGVPRHAVRGMAGQTDDTITDLYSHDLTSARKVQELPWVVLS